MGLNWNEIKSRALLFSKTWADACNEDSQAKPFWIDFFEIFGITNKRVATFELNVKKLGGAQGFVDLFWPGVLLVEHKSRGKSLDDAVAQAMGYLHHLSERDLPQLVVVCDFARFRVRRLASGQTTKRWSLNSSTCTNTSSSLACWRATKCKTSVRKTRSTSRPPNAWAACTTP
jgi:hypothetical protein